MKGSAVSRMIIVLVAIVSVSSAQQQQAVPAQARGRSVSVQSSPNGVSTMTVTTDGVQQVFITGPDGDWVAADGSGAKPPAGVGGMVVVRGGGMGFGQQGGGGGGGFGGMPGMQPALNQQQAKQKLYDTLKQSLGCTDEQWSALLPKIEKLQMLQSGAVVRPSATAAMTASDERVAVPLSVAEARARAEDFDRAVSDTDTPDDKVRQALLNLREARGKVKAELDQARKELTDMLTPRQEAILYKQGILAE